MMYDWTAEMVRFMKDASAGSDYFSRLSDILRKYLAGCSSVCDAGCGLGQLSVELADRGYRVTSIDWNRTAIGFLEKGGRRNGIVPLCCDLNGYTPEVPFDAMIFNYFGSFEQILQIGRRCCSGKLIIIRKNYRFHRFSFSPMPIRSHTGPGIEQHLTSLGVPFETEDFGLEFGQPFRSLDDAVLFFQVYSNDPDPGVITLENVRKKLVATENPEFPYYLPHRKESKLISVNAGDLI